ncbi:MAG: hypothetical protein HYY96_13020 [Candidatus Tectomicrobia bacterium]|nr:hypothetical protein [Candidatus Tectomicrobia bacterium]
MKCPKCGYVSFNYLDACKKCGTDLVSFKHEKHLDLPAPRHLNIVLGPGGLNGARLHMDQEDAESLLTADEVLEDEAEAAPAADAEGEEHEIGAAPPSAPSGRGPAVEDEIDLPLRPAPEPPEAAEQAELEEALRIPPFAAEEEPLLEPVELPPSLDRRGRPVTDEPEPTGEPLGRAEGALAEEEALEEIEFEPAHSAVDETSITQTPEPPPMQSDPRLVEELDFDLTGMTNLAESDRRGAAEAPPSPLTESGELEEITFESSAGLGRGAEKVASPPPAPPEPRVPGSRSEDAARERPAQSGRRAPAGVGKASKGEKGAAPFAAPALPPPPARDRLRQAERAHPPAADEEVVLDTDIEPPHGGDAPRPATSEEDEAPLDADLELQFLPDEMGASESGAEAGRRAAGGESKVDEPEKLLEEFDLSFEDEEER